MKSTILKAPMLLMTLLSGGAASAAPEIYMIDSDHSFANWSIRHVVSKTTGTFNGVTGTITIDRDNLANSSVNAKINVLSVNSGHAKRDAHIIKDDYLDAGKFAEMHFVSTQVASNPDKNGERSRGILHGDLTLHGVTKSISLPFEVLGFGKDPWGGERSGFEARTMIKASDYGFGWGAKVNGAVGDDIEVILLIEGVKAPTVQEKK